MTRATEPHPDHLAELEAVRRLLGTVLVAEIVAPLNVAAQLGDQQWLTCFSAWRQACLDAAGGVNGAVIAGSLDSLAMLFEDAAAAITCAGAIIEAGGRHELPVRAGLHTGEMVRHGELVTGIAPLLASMVASHAQAGEIVATHTVLHAAGTVEVAFEPAGMAAFPGLAVDWKLFRIGAQGLRGSSYLPSTAAEPAVSPARLSPRELEIASLVAAGRANREIADELDIAPATVERHVANILMKLGFRSRAQVAGWMVERGLFQPPDR